ncbi:MAG: leucine-rich repeat domain-containing protein [Lachnospiraceae bacterium]|nr:leucine-rich repeat domain-containing protein [Lachnospiraceae bacterium]
MQRKQLDMGADRLEYMAQGRGITITAYHGSSPVVYLPEEIEHRQVTCLAKKAFLGQKQLRRIILPKTVERLEDWAFANCDSLEEITLSHNCTEYGKGVFQGCKALKRILTEGGNSKFSKEEKEQIGTLLAATVNVLDATHLFSLKEAGSKKWLQQWDYKLLQYLRREDKQGFTVVVLCGEEDYGSDENSLTYFLRQKRQAKVRLCFLRLLNPLGMEKDTEKELKDYLQSHSKGCDSEETWQVVFHEHGNERIYYQMMMDCNCINSENLQGFLSDLGDNYSEMKSFLLQYKQEKLGVEDFFQTLSFDL